MQLLHVLHILSSFVRRHVEGPEIHRLLHFLQLLCIGGQGGHDLVVFQPLDCREILEAFRHVADLLDVKGLTGVLQGFRRQHLCQQLLVVLLRVHHVDAGMQADIIVIAFLCFVHRREHLDVGLLPVQAQRLLRLFHLLVIVPEPLLEASHSVLLSDRVQFPMKFI